MMQTLKAFLSKIPDLTNEDIEAISQDLKVETYKKGTRLLQQGDPMAFCYFILKGCIRQYAIDPDGNEQTSEFYTEEQAVVIYSCFIEGLPSPYSFECLEDTICIVGEPMDETLMYAKHPKLMDVTRRMMLQNLGSVMEDMSAFKAGTPEHRMERFLKTRSALLERVPQYQLASYLGMTPESFSRIKNRLLKKA